MNFLKYRKEKLLPILVNRASIFFLLMCILTFSFYAAGNTQDFLDSTQLFLLRLYVILGTFLITSSFFGAILEIIRVFREKKIRYFLRASAYILMLIFGIISIMAVLFIIALSQGNTAY